MTIMDKQKSPTVEFKRKLTNDVKREIIAFANTQGGELYIGMDDDGSVVGLKNAKKVLKSVTNTLRDSIRPDISGHNCIELETIDDKEIIKISVSRGTKRPYHLKNKGLNPSGVFIRDGISITKASEDKIRQMILETDSTHFESMRSIQQDLTFHDALEVFNKQGKKFGSKQQRKLGMLTEDGYFTNLALLFSDQCEHSIKCARFLDSDKPEIQESKEFNGSILTQVEQTLSYIHPSSHNDEEHERFPAYALREALINAVTHRDYSYNGSTLVHLFQNEIEIISVGGLVKGLTAEDIELGVSQSRNAKLAHVLHRLKWMEKYGTGLQCMVESYKDSTVSPTWQIGPNAFVVTLPKKPLLVVQTEGEPLTAWLSDHPEFSAKELETFLNKSKTTVRKILDKLIVANQIERIGHGPKTKYQIIN